MKLQLALDRMSIHEAVAIAKEAEPYIDWLEIGTSLIKEFGMDSLRQIRRAFPDLYLVADIKTFDNAAYEFNLCFDNGADAATVMAAAPEETLAICRTTASSRGKRCIYDLLNVPASKAAALTQERDAVVCFHVGKDQQQSIGKSAAGADWLAIDRSNSLPPGHGAAVAVAGGITLGNARAISFMKPDIVIVGSAITKAADPRQAAEALKQTLVGPIKVKGE